MIRSSLDQLTTLTLENQRLERELRTDELTGLGNARDLRERLRLSAQGNVGVLFLDLDHFKSINESHGHLAASGVLAAVVELLGSLVSDRSAARAFRYAGDEFVVLLPNIQQVDEAVHFAEHVRSRVESTLFRVDGHRGKQLVRLTVSVGCRLKLAGDSAEQILAEADRALFEAKRKSRNAVVAYSL